MNNTQIKTGGAVTAQYDFYPATQEGEKLFSVRGGVPLREPSMSFRCYSHKVSL